jgi:hypothetical protein
MPLWAADISTAPPQSAQSDGIPQTPNPPFPRLYTQAAVEQLYADDRAQSYGVLTEQETLALSRRWDDYKTLLMNTDIVAFYGSPLSKRMGILGMYPLGDTDARLEKVAQDYDRANGDRGVQRAFYIIYGTVWPEGEIGILQDSILRSYIEYAQAKNILVFLDHQIGKFSVTDSLKKMLPFLRYPNVHLALDPEWRTLKPMQEIGSVTAKEINDAQQIMEDYIEQNNISGQRLLVIHQFNWKMIQKREQVRTDFARVRLIHCADGFGSPAVKRASYAYNALATNMPIKGFKLFYNSGIPGAGYDDPLLTPAQALSLDPKPALIMYQ